MENLLILDTETTGLNYEEHEIIEIGAILYNVPTRCIASQFSTLFPCKNNEAEHINKIPSKLLLEKHIDFSHALFQMIKKCDAIVAHNAEFDKKFVKKIFVAEKKWICTKDDFKWPIQKGSNLNLINISLEMGVPVVSAHRALTDCKLIADCFSKLDDLEDRLNDALKERELYMAVISFDKKEIAKQEGFYFDYEFKRWIKKLTEEEAKKLPFDAKKLHVIS